MFGSSRADSDTAVGGKLTFFDAFHKEPPDPTDLAARAQCSDGTWNRRRIEANQQDDRNRPYWDPIRRTCVAVSNSLDRRLKSSKDKLLYCIEYIPPGESFLVEIGGENLTPREIGLLLHLLETFNEPEVNCTRLGALESNSWGRLIWTDVKVFRLTAHNLSQWVKNPGVGYQACTEIVDAEKLKNQAVAPVRCSRSTLSISLSVIVESPWLIRDPRQRDRAEAAKKRKEKEEAKPPDAVPIHDENGRPFVPAKSLRGALRARAELILRTLELQCARHPDDLEPVTTKGLSLAKAFERVRKADLAARLFGLPGWRAPLRVTRLTLAEGSPPILDDRHQEHVAIDRFTGGAADALKYNADLAGTATLTGQLTVDLARLKEVDPDCASIALLALVLRDLAEGDIPIGSGCAKGQGACRAEATITHCGQTYNTLSEWFASNAVNDSLQALRASCPTPATTTMH